MNLKPYFIIPLLVEQPTWGGEYIAEFKNLKHAKLEGQKIGQSFELYGESLLATEPSSEPRFALATATDVAHPELFGETTTALPIGKLLAEDAAAMLGRRVTEKTQGQLKTLIKFTQAKSNSYQAHVKIGQEFGHWQPKPESWYYFEPGLITLGLAPGCDVAEYQQRCLAIDAFAQDISRRIKAGELSLPAGKQELKAFIDEDHPRRFVNTVRVERDHIIDLSGGGIHHSWEVDPGQPLGNIVYEVQLDVRDENCTLRSFDQGSIKDDGGVRPLSIEDYFHGLDRNATFNQPEHFFQTTQTRHQGSATLTELFTNEFYRTTLLDLPAAARATTLELDDSFAHVFVKTGQVTLATSAGELTLAKGQAAFVPAGLSQYQLTTDQASTVIVTQA